MALNHSQDQYPFILNPKTDRNTLAEFASLRGTQMQLLVPLGERLDRAGREALHTLVLELGLQLRILKGAL